MDLERAINQGIQDAASRLSEAISTAEVPPKVVPGRQQLLAGLAQGEQADQFRNLLLEVLKGEPLNEPFARVFSELTTVAQASRFLFGEPLLTPEEVRGFMESLNTILNSFRHV